MFDSQAPDADVVDAITDGARAEAAAAARRLAAIAELVTRRADGATDRAHWSCDNWDAIAAEVAAAQGISHALASAASASSTNRSVSGSLIRSVCQT
ncbi:DUF222 domain-containing protein, partial [Mycobacterium sp. E2327]|uniref:DUF222 domain-containing protein n=1 Tax=Mycobacterium sp. E2327 TaxID=1834132 RepID=UPI000ACEDBB9